MEIENLTYEVFIDKGIKLIEKVAEYKVEMICSKDKLPQVIAALKAAHPYEEPAYVVIKLEDV